MALMNMIEGCIHLISCCTALTHRAPEATSSERACLETLGKGRLNAVTLEDEVRLGQHHSLGSARKRSRHSSAKQLTYVVNAVRCRSRTSRIDRGPFLRRRHHVCVGPQLEDDFPGRPATAQGLEGLVLRVHRLGPCLHAWLSGINLRIKLRWILNILVIAIMIVTMTIIMIAQTYQHIKQDHAQLTTSA